MKKTILFTILILVILISGCVEQAVTKEEMTQEEDIQSKLEENNIKIEQEVIEKPKKIIKKSCLSDTDCELISTNCCPESSGAHWECINLKESQIPCPENPTCLTVYSKKPTEMCLCINNKCERENKLHHIFYNSQCYEDNKDRLKSEDLEFRIEQFNDIQFNVKSGEIPYGHKYYVELLSSSGDGGYVIITNYDVIEKQNADGWRIFGGIFPTPVEGGGSIQGPYGCLLIIDEDSSEILVEGWDSAT